MTDYELTFIIRQPSEEQEFALLDNFDCIVGHRHDGLSFVTVWAPGNCALSAARVVHAHLVAAGVVVKHLEYDLVGRTELAQRLGITRQAVGNYVRGERRLGAPFPAVFNDVAGGVWVWADVVDWCRQQDLDDPRPGVGYPTRRDIETFNAELHAWRARTSVPVQMEPAGEANPAQVVPESVGYRYVGEPAA